MFSQLFHVALYQPIFNAFVGLYNLVPGHDIGLVIIIMTIIIRVIVYPLTAAAIKSQKSMQELQPKMEAVKIKYKDDQQQQAVALMQLYKDHKVNPFSSCLPLLIQIPILIALYTVFRDGLTLTDLSKNLYSFVADPGRINSLAFGFLDLGKKSLVLALLAGGAQYLQAAHIITKQPPKNAGTGSKDESMTAIMNTQMKYMMPILTVVIGMGLPAGLTLYWCLTTVFTWLQQIFIFKKKDNDPSDTSSGSSNNDNTPIIEGKTV